MTSSFRRYTDEKNHFILLENEVINDHSIEKKIGKGAYGIVCLATDLKLEEQCVFKIIKNRVEYIKCAEYEIKFLKRFDNYYKKHKYVREFTTLYIDSFFFNTHKFIKMKKYGGDLYHETKSKPLNENESLVVIKDIILGLNFLKKNKSFNSVIGFSLYFEYAFSKLNFLTISDELKNVNFSSNSKFLRFKDALKLKPQMTSALFRKKIILNFLKKFLKTNYRFILKDKVTFPFNEAIFFLPLICGKTKVEKKIWQYRDREIFKYKEDKLSILRDQNLIDLNLKNFNNSDCLYEFRNFFKNQYRANTKKKDTLKFIDNFYPQGEVVYIRLIFMKFMNKIKIFMIKCFPQFYNILKMINKAIRISLIEKKKYLSPRDKNYIYFLKNIYPYMKY